MQNKWKIYLIALFSYSSIHAIRTMWSAMKSDLNGDPYDFQVSFLGTLDMLTLFVAAIFMNIFGPKLESWGIKKALVRSMICLSILTSLLALFLCSDITSPWVYVLFFSLGVGFFSSVGWPCCLCVVSCYFDKGDRVALSAYNGSSQLGDFTSLITYYGMLKLTGWPPQSSFFFTSTYLIIYIVLISYFFPSDLQKISQKNKKQNNRTPPLELNQQKVHGEGNNDNFEINSEQNKEQQVNKEELILKELQNHSQITNEDKVTPFSVWLIPGVALNVLAYGFIKAINSFIVGWLVYYLLSIGLGAQSILITILWSGSIFLGGIASAYFNKQYSKKIFIFQLLIALICFIFLEEFHNKIYQVEIILCLVICAFFYGGPYNLMSTAIPLVLGSQPQVVKYSNGKGAVISLMEGYGQFFCGVSLLIVPLFDVNSINGAGAVYCGLAVTLLGAQMFFEKRRSDIGLESDRKATVEMCDS